MSDTIATFSKNIVDASGKPIHIPKIDEVKEIEDIPIENEVYSYLNHKGTVFYVQFLKHRIHMKVVLLKQVILNLLKNTPP